MSDREAPESGSGERAPGWIELALAIIMALAAVGTAWAGFQSAKWGGVQANSYAQASASRIESSKAAAQAGQQRLTDVISFTSWLNALQAEIAQDPSVRPDGSYTPDPDELSGFLYSRFRDEFRPAMEAWLETRPLVSPDAPGTPFEMDEYRLDADQRAADLVTGAEDLSAEARQANQRSDNYVLTAVALALSLFFAGVATRVRRLRTKKLLIVLSAVTLAGSALVLALSPVTI
ncbi:hypothetical protein [Glycomyces salinus]|uniref:hypothetical protein n=1 Tax=Glycomyces salinus TaxID=980294 RepID=UPI0018EBD56D|nr:hypothetical protein [Glycomyces salinus]